MFHTKILNFNSIIYDGFADKVLFNIKDHGQIGILTNHIEDNFKIVPSICYVFFKEQKYIFYIGYGFARFLNNHLSITSNLITDYVNYKTEAQKFGSYASLCLNNFKRIRL